LYVSADGVGILRKSLLMSRVRDGTVFAIPSSMLNVEALAKPLADATERVPPVHKSPLFVIFGGPRSVVAAFGEGFASASFIKE
jgi:hypothetical protein